MNGVAEMPVVPIAGDPAWNTPPEFVQARCDEVHVWRASLEVAPSEVRRLGLILSEDERERAVRFRFERDRSPFIVRRALLRMLLGRYLQITPSKIEFSYGTKGKPYLAGSEHAALRFNLSHSRGLALYAVTRKREIGVDLEYESEKVDIDAIARRFFSAREVAAIKSLPDHEKRRAFFACWTRKEACIKARGEGLSIDLESFSVSVSPDQPAALLNAQNVPEETSRWSLADLNPDSRYVGAIAVEGRDWRLKCWQLTGDMQELPVTVEALLLQLARNAADDARERFDLRQQVQRHRPPRQSRANPQGDTGDRALERDNG